MITRLFGHMVRIDKRILERQIDVFVEWGIRHRIASPDYKGWLEEFRNFTNKEDISDISKEDIDLFVQNIYNTNNSRHALERARISVESLYRFYMARSKNALIKNKRGRPPAIGQILKAKEYRKKGLSLAEIGKLLDSDKSLVHRWLKRTVEGLYH